MSLLITRTFVPGEHNIMKPVVVMVEPAEPLGLPGDDERDAGLPYPFGEPRG